MSAASLRAPKLRVPVSALAEGTVLLEPETSRYVVRVHRLEPGARFIAFDPEASLQAEAELISDRLPRVEVRVGSLRPAARPSFSLTLLQAVGKADKPEQVVRDATVLGAERILFVDTERCVARAARASKRERERRVAVEAARQCGRGDVPEIGGPLSLKEALASLSPRSRKLVLCWHDESEPLLSRLQRWDLAEELVVLVGPEGGLTAEEVDETLKAGFEPSTMGAFVLRTETAATVALGVVQSYAEARLREALPAAASVSPP